MVNLSMDRHPRYLPHGDYVPKGWPQGTGITLSRTPGTPDDRISIAVALVNFGCRPDIALLAADEILAKGAYSTRVRTQTAMCLNLAEDLAAVGVALEFEAVIPNGNIDHALSPENTGRSVRSLRFPGDARALVEETAAREPGDASPLPWNR